MVYSPTIKAAEHLIEDMMLSGATRTVPDAGKRHRRTRADLDAIAERIRQRIRRTTADIIETGQDLRLVKGRLDHGQFIAWIKREFGMSPRSAQRFMLASEWAKDKSDTVSLLPPNTLYTLSAKSTPEVVRERVVADLAAGHRIDPRDVQELVRVARTEQRINERSELRRKTKNFRSSAKYRNRQEREERERQERREREVEAAIEIIGLLKKLPAEDFNRIRELMCDNTLWVPPQVVQLMKDDSS